MGLVPGWRFGCGTGEGVGLGPEGVRWVFVSGDSARLQCSGAVRSGVGRCDGVRWMVLYLYLVFLHNYVVCLWAG